ncbi:MAG: hypothetical protein ACRDK3_01890 [Actinomycetota bacterium]
MSTPHSEPDDHGSAAPGPNSTPPPPTIAPEIVVEDFRQQCAALQNQYSRMHNRMQLLTGLNTALLPALATVGIASSEGNVDSSWLLLFPVTGLLLSGIGFVIGKNDRWLVTVYRRQLSHMAQRLLEASERDPAIFYEGWLHAGRDPAEVEQLLPRESRATWWDRLVSGRWEPVSVTRLPAVLSLTFAVVWVAVLIVLLGAR